MADTVEPQSDPPSSDVVAPGGEPLFAPTPASTHVPAAPAQAWRGPNRLRPESFGFCVSHREVTATRRCDRCRAPMCDTCDFAFADGSHACPACVADPSAPVSGKRTTLAVVGLVLAAFATATLGAMMSGVWELTEEQAGTAFTALIFLPGLAGLVFACSAMNKRLGNNALLWTSTIWNLVLSSTLVILVVLGNLRS